MPEYKPFSIYDDDDKEKKPVSVPPEMKENPGELDLEIEDVPSQDDEQTRQDLMRQLNMADPGGPAAPLAPEKKHSEALDKTPFLQGQPTEALEERAKEMIQERRKTGKIRDRRKTASIFDKPIEPDKPIQQGKAAWHPLGYRAQAFWFLAPALVFFGLFYLYPTLKGFQISLTHYSPLGQSVDVGWDNYTRAFDDPRFIQTVANATFFTLFSLVLGLWPPLLLAIILNEISYGKGLFKVLYLLPFVIPAIPAANLWRWIFDDSFGVLNDLLRLLSLPPVGWLTDPKWALISIVLVFVWKNTGWFTLIYYAVLQNLPEELYEASELDGAGVGKKVLNVTLPHLMPVLWILSIIQVLTAFQIFTEVYVMTNGGPMHATEVIGTYIYKTAFGSMDLGYASAMAMLMFAGLFLFTMVRFFQIKRVSR